MLLPVPKCSLSLCGVLRCMLTRCQLLISQQTTTFSVYPHRNKAGLRQSLHCVHTSRLKQTRLTAKQQHRRGDAKCIPSASFMSLFDALLTCLGVNLNICCMWIALPCWWFRYRVFGTKRVHSRLQPPQKNTCAGMDADSGASLDVFASVRATLKTSRGTARGESGRPVFTCATKLQRWCFSILFHCRDCCLETSGSRV